jgi:hypothetical protein
VTLAPLRGLYVSWTAFISLARLSTSVAHVLLCGRTFKAAVCRPPYHPTPSGCDTMRDPNVGTGMWSGQQSALSTASCGTAHAVGAHVAEGHGWPGLGSWSCAHAGEDTMAAFDESCRRR